MMRISLHARSPLPFPQRRTSNVPVSVLIRPANHVDGSFEYQTDRESLLKLLREKTDLSGYVLEGSGAVGARLARGREGQGRGPQADRVLHRLNRLASGRLQACLEDVFPAPIACGAVTSLVCSTIAYATMQPRSHLRSSTSPDPQQAGLCCCCCFFEGEVWRGAAPSKGDASSFAP